MASPELASACPGLTLALERRPPEQRAQLLEDLQQRFENPPVLDVQRCLQTTWISNEVQTLMFNPDVFQIQQLYPVLLRAGPLGRGVPQIELQASQLRLQSTFIVLLAAVHVHDVRLFEAFVECGGLRDVVDLVVHDSLYVVGHAMDLLQAVYKSDFPLWRGAQVPNCLAAVNGPNARVWQAALGLLHSSLVANVITHMPDTYSGSATMALRILTNLADWLATFFCQEGLQMSAQLKALLHPWESAADQYPAEAELVGSLFVRYGGADLGPAAATLDVLHSRVPGLPHEWGFSSDSTSEPSGGSQDAMGQS